jgi:hypothetical protein
VPAERIGRIKPSFLEEERRQQGESYYRQEYCCSFEALEGLVYPDFGRCVVDALPAHVPDVGTLERATRATADGVELVGGMDFGYRNPFAAIWGVKDRDDVLWLTGEHYGRGQPLSAHARKLPREVVWYADPSGANEIVELRCGGFVMRKGENTLAPGIGAVHTRLAAGTLKVLKGRCPNLLAEAGLYRYATGPGADRETPVDEHNHALAALRYLIARIDAHRQVRAPLPAPPDAHGRTWPADDDAGWIPLLR